MKQTPFTRTRLEEPDYLRVMVQVRAALDAWERSNPVGSARPTFERAWQQACRERGRLGSPKQREAIWQNWLAAGKSLTAARREAIVARLTPAARAWLSCIPVVNAPDREPGEDDDEEPPPWIA